MRQHLVPMKRAYTTTLSHVYKPVDPASAPSIILRLGINRKVMPKAVQLIEVSVVYEEPK